MSLRADVVGLATPGNWQDFLATAHMDSKAMLRFRLGMRKSLHGSVKCNAGDHHCLQSRVSVNERALIFRRPMRSYELFSVFQSRVG